VQLPFRGRTVLIAGTFTIFALLLVTVLIRPALLVVLADIQGDAGF